MNSAARAALKIAVLRYGLTPSLSVNKLVICVPTTQGRNTVSQYTHGTYPRRVNWTVSATTRSTDIDAIDLPGPAVAEAG